MKGGKRMVNMCLRNEKKKNRSFKRVALSSECEWEIFVFVWNVMRFAECMCIVDDLAKTYKSWKEKRWYRFYAGVETIRPPHIQYYGKSGINGVDGDSFTTSFLPPIFRCHSYLAQYANQNYERALWLT